MKKIRRLSLVLFIFSVLAFSYPVTQVFAQGGQCDSSPACNPASGTCCGQCDPSPACNPNDPNGIPCCGLEGNNMTNGSQPPGGFEPPRRPLKKNDLDPRLVEKMKKMGQELEACRSLQEEIRGQQQTARRQAPARCQPDTTLQRQLEEANQRLDRICEQVTDRYEDDRLPVNQANVQQHGMSILASSLYHKHCKQNPCWPSRCPTTTYERWGQQCRSGDNSRCTVLQEKCDQGRRAACRELQRNQ